MATKLDQKRDELTEKQKRLAKTFELAGEDFDFAKDDVLKHLDVKTSAEAVTRVREWNKELDDVADQVKEQDGLAAIKKANQEKLDAPANAPPMPSGTGGGNGGPQRREFKSLGDRVVESDAYKSYRESGGPKGMLASFGIEDFGLAELKYYSPELKTLMTTTAGWAPESIRIPGLVIEDVTRPIQILDIIPPGNTDMAAVVYMEETTRTHAAAEATEGAAFAESTFALTEQSSTVRKIADSLPVTDEQLEDVAGVRSYIDQRLMFGLRQRLDNQVLQGNGTAPNLRGVLNVAGIQTQAKGADSVPDAIYKALVLVRVTGRAFPSHVLLHSNDWQTIRLLTTADGIYIWGAPMEAGPFRIWGLPVIENDVLTENTGLVGDFRNFSQLYEKRGVDVQVGYVGTQFTEGERTIRADLRVAFVVYRPAAFCTVTGI